MSQSMQVVCVRVCVHARARACVCVCMYVCMYVYMYMCVIHRTVFHCSGVPCGVQQARVKQAEYQSYYMHN
jgi:hypothetical protein